MSKSNHAKIPLGLAVLDFIGALLLATGFYDTFSGNPLVPVAWQFGGYNLAFMLVGALFTTPLIAYLVAQARHWNANRPSPTIGRNQ